MGRQLGRSSCTYKDLIDEQANQRKKAKNAANNYVCDQDIELIAAVRLAKRKMVAAEPTTEIPRRGIIQKILDGTHEQEEDLERFSSIRILQKILHGTYEQEEDPRVPAAKQKIMLPGKDALHLFMYEYFLPPTAQRKQSYGNMTDKWLEEVQTPPFTWVRVPSPAPLPKRNWLVLNEAWRRRSPAPLSYRRSLEEESPVEARQLPYRSSIH
jgi:hypothetical protein